MSNVAVLYPIPALIDEEGREAKLEAAKKKLRKYRSTQTSSSSTNTKPFSTSCQTPLTSNVRPLATNLLGNIDTSQARSANSDPKEAKMYGQEVDPVNKPIGGGHSRQASMSARHRRNESVARSQGQGGFAPAGWSMPNAASSSTPTPSLSGSLFPPIPTEIITTPATPQTATDELPSDPFAGPPLPPVSEGEEDVQAARQRFTSFSFGAKAPRASSSPLASPIPSPARSGSGKQSSFPSQQGVSGLFSSAPTDVVPPSEFSLTPSRPPSLLFTAPTPSQPTSDVNAPERPSTPPAERRKRHSHTRSSSISMPNLRLGRPVSLGIPTSSSYPGSPTSPITEVGNAARKSAPTIASKLKFEPSEAEKEKEEGRRKALEKLTGSSPLASPLMDEPQAAISLPTDEDEDIPPVRPLSGIYTSPTFSFGRPNSLNLPSLSSSISSSTSSTPPLSWSAGEDMIGMPERWSFGQSKEDSYGFALDMPKRASQTGTLAVLAEEDEAAAEEEEIIVQDEGEETLRSVSVPADVPTDVALDETTSISPSSHRPTPSRLRELHLVTSVSSSTPSRSSSSIDSAAIRPISPTKSQGLMNRARPRPLSGVINSSASIASTTSPASALITPAGSTRMQRRQSRGSSIGYMKDGSTSSSASAPHPVNRWSISSRDMVSPPPDALAKNPISSRSETRPASLAGLGYEGFGGMRVLSKVSENEEDLGVLAGGDGWRPEAVQRPESYMFQSFSSGPSSGRRASHESTSEETAWREQIVEMRMERDALKEDVQGWKERCSSAENRLEEEKRNNGILRERVRKLGDWLLNVPGSSPSGSAAGSVEDTRILRDLQDQLFALTASLEQERREKEQAAARVVELEREMSKLRFESRTYGQIVDESTSVPDSPFVATAAATPTRSPFISPGPSGNNTPAASTPDNNDQRIRAWGFPRGPIMCKKENKRESFFGLSRDLRGSPLGSMNMKQDQSSEDFSMMGVDLPPVACADASQETPGPVEPCETRGARDEGTRVRLDKRTQAGRWIDASSSISTTNARPEPQPPTSAQSLDTAEGETPDTVAENLIAATPGAMRYVTAISKAYEPPWKANQTSGNIPWYARGSSGIAPPMGLGLDLRAVCRCCRGEVMEL